MAEKKETKMQGDNLRYYELLRKVPNYALKEIGAGRLKGMSDINPVYRIKAMTEAFGPCGIGWKYVITKQWLETYGQEVKAFCNIDLFIKVDGEWSDAIPGTGGSSLVAMERSGAYVSDECLDGDCELLTRNGWIKLRDFEESSDEEVAQYFPYSEIIDFCKPLRFIHKKSSDVYDKEGFLMTAHHRHIVYSRGTNDIQVKFAEDLAKLTYKESESGYGRSCNFRDIKCGHFAIKRQLSVIDKVGIMLACDGTLYRQNSDGTIYWRCEFSKDRKIKKAESLLESLKVKYKKETNKRSFGNTTSFVFNLGSQINYKDYRNFLPLGDYECLWDEIISWDGCKKDHESFSTTNKESAEYLQTLLSISGEVISVYKQERTDGHSDIYTLYRKKHLTAMSGFKKVEGTYDMYCVDVPTTFILIRKNGEILVTGNCHKMALTDALSVAMKSLGVAADVYYSKDKVGQFDTKYEQQSYVAQQNTQQIQQPAAQPQAQQPAAVDASVYTAEISQCADMNALMVIWNKYPQLQTDMAFRDTWAARRRTIEGR